MTSPNLDGTWYHWVDSLVRFTFSIEHQKGQYNAAADALSWVTLKLDVETMKSILDGVTVWMTERVDTHDLAVTEADEEYISKSGKQQFWLEPTMHMWTYMWLIGWLPNRRIQYLRL